MFRYVFALAILGAVATPVHAQDAIPDLKGTWTGKGKSIVFGNNAHHAGKQTITNPPRVRDIEAIHVVDEIFHSLIQIAYRGFNFWSIVLEALVDRRGRRLIVCARWRGQCEQGAG